MIRAVVFCITLIALLWVPLPAALLLVAGYSWRWDGVELLIVAVAIDWLLVPTWPFLSMATAVIVVVLPYVRRATMLYN